ncbi:MAG: preprotein translocase subunit SecY [Thiotrichales bacterium 16-46-22]|nr:MAG: preprotein translocase subunit SecY [Thiotrichales bacterium 16-46-22]
MSAMTSAQTSWSQELVQRIFFVIGALIVYRLGAHIPVPSIDPIALAAMFAQQKGTILDMFNMFSGGALERLSVLALGIMPYISASIIVQLLTIVSPTLEQLKKEGESGRRKIEAQQINGLSVVIDPGLGFKIIAVSTLVAGTIFLMWLGEQITERGMGNGISIIIFAGIVAGLPSALGGTLELVSTGELGVFVVFLLLSVILLVTAFVVFVESGQRKITVHFSQRTNARAMFQQQVTHIPFKLNMAGVIPPIFASSIILFPASLGGWFGASENMGWLKDIATTLSPGQPLYVGLYALAILFFTFFYTAVAFNPKDTADNLRRSGAFIPGIRPGDQTARYLDTIMSRLTLAGALYITAVCLLPEFLILYWNVPFYFGGTSLLIIVVVVMDFMTQMQSFIMSGQYPGMMKKMQMR